MYGRGNLDPDVGVGGGIIDPSVREGGKAPGVRKIWSLQSAYEDCAPEESTIVKINSINNFIWGEARQALRVSDLA